MANSDTDTNDENLSQAQGLASLGSNIGEGMIVSSVIVSLACLYALFAGTPDIQDAIIEGLSPRQDFIQATEKAEKLDQGEKATFVYKGRSYDITPSPAPR